MGQEIGQFQFLADIRNFLSKLIFSSNRNGYSWSTALALSVFLGNFGIDRFYLGYPAIGLIKFVTFGGFMILNCIDIILISTQVCFS